MSRLFIVMMLIATCCPFLSGQTFNALEIEGIKGRVMLIETAQDTVIHFGKDTALGEYVFMKYYDTLGRPTADFIFALDGQCIRERRHQYSPDGCQKLSLSSIGTPYLTDEGRESIHWLTENVLKVDSVFDEQGAYKCHTLYKYDDRGLLVEEKGHYPNQDHSERITYAYDSLGRLIHKARFYPGFNTEKHLRYAYDISGHVTILEIRTMHKGVFEGGTNNTYEYNQQGNLVRIISDGEGSDQLTTTFECDTHGNWIHSVEVDGEGSTIIRHRKVTYW